MSDKVEEPDIDWSLTTWEGSRREQLRRWSKLPLERIIAAIEEMSETSRQLTEAGRRGREGSSIMEKGEDYSHSDDTTASSSRGGQRGKR